MKTEREINLNKRIKQLEKGYDELRTLVDKKIEQLEQENKQIDKKNKELKADFVTTKNLAKDFSKKLKISRQEIFKCKYALHLACNYINSLNEELAQYKFPEIKEYELYIEDNTKPDY